MNEKISLILTLIGEGHTTNEIQNILGIDYKELNRLLKLIRNAGYNYTKSISSTGEITLKTNRTLNLKEKKSIRINVKDRIFKAIFISDLHIGGAFEKTKLLSIVYDYARKHGCNIIFNGGDLIDNIYHDSANPPKNKTVLSQVQKVLRVYPFDSDITNLILYGNHDYKSVIEQGFDVGRYLEERRYDLVSLGYGLCVIHLKDDVIAITHDLTHSNKIEAPDFVTITYRGHSHKSKTRDNKIVYVPALSESSHSVYEYRPLAGFLDVEFTFYEKKIARINTRQLAIVNNEVRLANEDVVLLNPDFHDKPKRLEKK